MSPEELERQADRELAETMQVGHALIMLAELPGHSANTAYPIAVRMACLESFFSNLRLMFEFLIDKPKRGHIHRYDYLPGWNPPAMEAVTALRRRHGFASEQVSHLARSRVPAVGGPIVMVPLEELKKLAVLTLDIAQQFTDALEDVPLTETFRGYVEDARSRIRA
jgi:hypothetical protein